MKIGVLLHTIERSRELSNMGQAQAGYMLIQALSWFGHTGSQLARNLHIFHSTQINEFSIGAMAAVTCSFHGHVVTPEELPIAWTSGHNENDSPAGSKSGTLAQRLIELDKKFILIAGWFDLKYNLEAFLKPFDIPLPSEWPDRNKAALIRIDTDTKTLEIDYVPYPPNGDDY